MAENEYINPMTNPGQANTDIAGLIASQSAGGSKPVISLPTAPDVHLPGGLVLTMDLEDAKYDAEVRELTGVDEEKITRARLSNKVNNFYNAILAAGTVSIGGTPVDKEVLGSLLIGDADYLMREIRRATYGDEMEFVDLICPHCQEQYSMTLTLDDIPIRPLASSSDRVFDVLLRKNRSALVRLPTNSDRDLIASSGDLNSAEQNTLLLSRCIISITNGTDEPQMVAAQRAPVKAMSIPDRQTVLKEITERQPGPQFDDVTYLHDPCGQEVHFAVSIGDLFLGL